MADLSCKYLNLQLQNPFLVNCSELKDDVEKIIGISKAGAAGIVLHPIFEEEIEFDENRMSNIKPTFPEAADYISFYSKENSREKYLQLIKDVKNEVKTPVLAGINCLSAGEWMSFAKKIEEAGADALELNVFFFPNDKDFKAEDYERIYYDIVTKVTYMLSIPVVLKIGPFFTNLLHFTDELIHRGIKGIELFNFTCQPDIDIDLVEYTNFSRLNNPVNFNYTLRSLAMISSQIVRIQSSVALDKPDSSSAIKLLLAGANSVCLYSSHEEILNNFENILKEVDDWMIKKGFENIEQIQGQLNYSIIPDAFLYERSQYTRKFN
jgi:dihydroorotate dehydrogenase (fumarate)